MNRNEIKTIFFGELYGIPERSEKMKHPIQPLVWMDNVIRFKENAIVRALYDYSRGHGMGLNELMSMPFNQDDWNQFAQLIGWSVSGFGGLYYADPEIVAKADEEADRMTHELLKEAFKKEKGNGTR
jgi:hypothetical protein